MIKITPSDGPNLKKEDNKPLSERVKSIRCILKSRIQRMKGLMKTIYPSVFIEAEVRKELEGLHDPNELVPAYKEH